jgi:menaquinone-9 beta-reductase
MFDVVIVGGSVAGCTAAIQLARTGRKVAVLERSASSDHHKKLCTHFIQASAVPVLEKLGVVPAIEVAGGVRTHTRICTPWGWISDPETDTNQLGINLPRYLLDPILRKAAESQPTVRFHQGASVQNLLISPQGRVEGVVARHGGKLLEFRAPIVIAADGRNSAVAKLANIPTHTDANVRFSYFTYYPGSILQAGSNANFWHLDSRLAFAYENGDSTSLLGIFLSMDRLAEFKLDPLGNFRKFWETVPNAPSIGTLQPLTELRGYVSYPNQRRQPTIPGLALIGDAAISIDPMWAAGIGFALTSADLLVRALDKTTSKGRAASSVEQSVDCALHSYSRSLRRATRLHYWQIADFSKRESLNWIEQFSFAAAAQDVSIARTLFSLIQRKSNPTCLASPVHLGRCLRVHLKPWLTSIFSRLVPSYKPY